jgi:TPR repeat protein
MEKERMNSIVRNFVVPACVVALGAAAIVWNVERMRITERRFAEEVRQYQSGADQGDANAEYELGQMYARGWGVTQDFAQANYWYQKAAGQGFTKAIYAVGCQYYYGDGVLQSYSEALVWFHRAADQGDAIAQEALGGIYYHGAAVPQSYSEAMAWYRRAADENYSKAEYDMGYMYSHGLGVPRDRQEANRWYRKAASQGNVDAQLALGLRLPPHGKVFKFIPLLGFAGSLFFLIDFFRQKSSLCKPRVRETAVLSLILLPWSVMDWLQYSKYGLFPSAWAAYSFRAVTFFMAGIMASLVTTVSWPKAGKTLLVFTGFLFVVLNLALCAKARFDLGILSTAYWRFIVLDSFPLGMAISAAIHLWRRKREPADGAPEPPAESGETPDAV